MLSSSSSHAVAGTATETHPLLEQEATAAAVGPPPLAAFAAQDVQEASSIQQAPVHKKAAAAVSLVSRFFHPSSLSSRSLAGGGGGSVMSSHRNTNHRSNTRPPPLVIHTRKPAPSSLMSSSSSSLRSLTGISGDHALWNQFRRPSERTASTVSSSRSFLPRGILLQDNLAEEGEDEDEVVFLNKKKKQQQTNVVQWLSTECPTDVLPHVLSFCGPQMTRQLQGVNQFWHNVIQEESTWKVMCQDLYKWNPKTDPEPTSWKEYYRQRPCVPVDYTSVNEALDSAREVAGEQDIYVLLRPGRYFLNQSFTVNCLPQQKVTIATMKMPDNLFQSSPPVLDDAGSVFSFVNNTLGTHHQQQQRGKKRRGLLKLLMFTSAAYNDAAVDDDDNSLLEEQSPIPFSSTRATLVMRTRRVNEPAIRVLRGHFCAYNINVEHSSHGMDIWNGNAAIQIQPDPDLPEERPVAYLHGLRVTSRTGRGVVTIDGGQLTLQKSKVQECAATGVYIGGRGTRAQVLETDVVRNGVGSQRGASRRGGGIARGHSGIYLEQGIADILNCNVSNNTLTGITAVSHENSTLNLRGSDLLGNGSFQLEIPARNARGIYLNQNRLESTGSGRIRANLTF